MKRIVYLVIALLVIFMTSCLADEIPLVTYDMIASGECANKTVYIDCAISGFDDGFFKVWVKSNDGFFYNEGLWSFSYTDALTSDEKKAFLSDAAIGNMYRFALTVYHDNSFGSSNVQSIQKLDSTVDVTELTSQFKKNCTQIACKDILRNPDKYKDYYVSFSGTILQEISAKYGDPNYLLDTGEDNGIVYLSYSLNDGADKILETDKVTIYGRIPPKRTTETYSTLLGTKTVPFIIVYFVDFHN